MNPSLPPGCTNADIERNALGACPQCSRVLDSEGHCTRCSVVYCNTCGAAVDDINDDGDCEHCGSRKLDTIVCDLCELPSPRHETAEIGRLFVCKSCRHESEQ